MKRAALSVLFVAFVFAFQGCASMQSAFRGVEGQYAANYDQTWNASLATMKEMNFQVYDTQKSGNEGVINAVRPDGTKVKVYVTPAPGGANVTTARVRVGTMGNTEDARLIENKIQAKLGKR